MPVYEYDVKLITGEEISLETYRGQVLLIVNTASKCGFTPQYTELQKLYERYKEKGFVILGFPCNQFMAQEPGDDLEISGFCRMNYGVTFPMFSKIKVKGNEIHPLYNYLSNEAPGVLGSTAVKWNFTKFLVDKKGLPVKRYSPQTKPNEIEEDIVRLLEQ